jgi:hypothetical protein
VLPDQCAVMPRIGHEEHHLRRPCVVATFHGDSPLQCLNVSRPRLSLDCYLHSVDQHPRVPRPQVTNGSNRHLETPRNAGGHHCAEPIHEREMGRVPNWLARRVRPRSQLQADNGQ